MKNIYVAEDDPVYVKLIDWIFQRNKDYVPAFFSDGLLAYQKVQSNPPDVLLLDIVLPSLSGLAVARLVKFRDNAPRIPILVFSSVSEPDTGELARQCGADAFMPKPFTDEQLMEQVERLLAKGGTSNERQTWQE